jgi:hypothetical protein
MHSRANTDDDSSSDDSDTEMDDVDDVDDIHVDTHPWDTRERVAYRYRPDIWMTTLARELCGWIHFKGESHQ